MTRTDARGTKTSEFTPRTASEATLDARQVVPLEYSVNGKVTGWVYVIEDEAGILWYARQGAGQASATPFGKYAIRYPTKAGASWNDSVKSYLLPADEEVPVTATIATLSDSITVPAGRFENCLRLTSSGEKNIESGIYWGGTISFDATDWHCAGVGFVKSETKQRIDHPLLGTRATRSEVLISFSTDR